MKKLVAVLLVALAGLTVAAPATASYNGTATKKAFAWANRHHPYWAIKATVSCYSVGYHSSRCSITYRGGGSSCQTFVKVTGYRYHVWRYDSTC